MVASHSRHLGAQNHIPSHLWSLLLVIVLSCCSTVPKTQISGSADERLKNAVEMALAADDRLDDSTIVISVARGIVDLSGTAGSHDEVRRALRRAGGVDGVRGIVNRLLVVEQEAG